MILLNASRGSSITLETNKNLLELNCLLFMAKLTQFRIAVEYDVLHDVPSCGQVFGASFRSFHDRNTSDIADEVHDDVS